MPRHCLLLLVMLALGPVASGQEKDKRTPGDVMIEKYLATEADKLGAKFLDGAKTLDEWQAKRPRLQREYLDMLGLAPLPEKTPLKAAVTGQLEKHGVVVEKLHFQSRPGLYVTGNLYRPREVKEKLPAILYVCGHAFKGHDGNKSYYQEHGFWFANNGYVCLMLDTLQLGEIPGVHHGTFGTPWRHIKSYTASPGETLPKDVPENRFWWYAAGYTPAGVECWNGIRGLDYLQTRPEVDPDRLGVTGASGGGAATIWIAAADPRIKVAVPVSGMSDLESYVKNKVINGHCDCMFLYNTYQWDWTTIIAQIAPRPLLFCNSDNDAIFPMDGNRRIAEKLRKVYAMYGQPKLFDDYVSVGGHAYRPDLRVAIFKFLNKHLKGDTTTPVGDAEYAHVRGEDLRVFPDGDYPKDALNAKIDEVFVPRAQVKLPEAGKFAEWKKEMLAELERRSLHIGSVKIEPKGKYDADERISFLELSPGAISALAKVADDDPKAGFATLFVSSEDYQKGLPQGTLTDGQGLANFGLLPRQVFRKPGEITAWTEKSPPNYVSRSHALLGETIDRARLLETLGATRALAKQYKKPVAWRLVGGGSGGVVGAYAALYLPNVKDVVIINPPKSHKDGPYFLNVLRVLDIPEALGLLAPTPLTIIGDDPAFDRTAEIYRLAGAADKLKRK